MITFGSEFLGGVAKDAIDGMNILVRQSRLSSID